MKKFLFCFFLFFAKLAELKSCDCYDYDELKKIEWAINDYEAIARKHYFDDVPCPNGYPRETWMVPFNNQMKKLNESMLSKNLERYPVTYHNILIFDQKVSVMTAFHYENDYMRVFGPGGPYIAGSKKDKDAMVEKDRAITRKNEKKIRDVLEDSTSKIINIYLKLYESCLKEHASLQTYRDYGLLAHLNNNFEVAHEMLNRLMEEAEKTGQIDSLDSRFYHELGSVCVEAMEYNEAIKYLSQAIQKDPNNKVAHFDRALAYFETGNFEFALEDFLASDRGQDNKNSFQPSPVSDEFKNALLAGTVRGATEAAIDFIPSLCSTIYGAGEAIWAMHTHPIGSANKYAAACLEVSVCILDYCQSKDWKLLDDCCDQIQILHERYDHLTDAEKGDLIGSAIGTFGVDIIAGGTVLKGVKAARNLKHANRLCNLESLVVSSANKEAIIASACQHASKREAFFKNVKVQWDKQNKHILGKHNFESNKSIFEHPDPQELLERFAGKGRKINNELPGNPGYKEMVDFKEHIGIWKDNLGEQSPLPTTKGTIHYAKDGAHIVPAHPDSKTR